jgi:hypothetical protein
MDAEVRYVEAMLKRQRPGTDPDWDAEFAELHAYTQRLRERTIAMLTARMQ